MLTMSKTPLRVSFVGGGSDLPAYYREHGGAVISTAIQKYIYVLIKERFESGIRLSYSITENVNSKDEIAHPLVRNALDMVRSGDSLEIVSMADIPSTGTGLGSSSSFSVGLLNALSQFYGEPLSAGELAEKACQLEIDKAGSPIGKQDQYAAAFGGIRVYEFNSDDSVSESLVHCSAEALAEIDNNLLAFYVAGERDANSILKQQSEGLKQHDTKNDLVKEMVNLVWSLKAELESGNPQLIGKILHENWIIKRSLSGGISDAWLDDIYDTAMRAGCSGGKLLGAGGGGFMLFHAASEGVKRDLRSALQKYREVIFKREPKGSEIQHFIG